MKLSLHAKKIQGLVKKRNGEPLKYTVGITFSPLLVQKVDKEVDTIRAQGRAMTRSAFVQNLVADYFSTKGIKRDIRNRSGA